MASEEVTPEEIARNMLASFWSTAEVIANPEFQRRIWLGDDPEIRSSYVEVYCGIADDVNFDLIGEHLSELGITATEWEHIKRLQAEVLMFDADWADPYAQDRIIEDSHWHKVVNVAKDLLRARDYARATLGRNQN